MLASTKPTDSTEVGNPTQPALLSLSTGLTPVRPMPGAKPGLAGLCRGLPYATYHQDPALRHSILHRMSISPLYLFSSLEEEDGDSSDLTQGRVFHTLTLEPHLEAATVVVVDASDRRTNIFKAEAMKNPGKDLVLRKEYENLCRMRDLFQSKAINRNLISGAMIEAAVFWEDDRTGVFRKSRPDIAHLGDVVADVKTTRDMSRFLYDAESYGYFNQLADQADGIRAITGHSPKAHLLVAVEKTGARDSKIFDVTSKIAKARRENALYLEKYARCLASGRWTGYAEAIEEVAP